MLGDAGSLVWRIARIVGGVTLLVAGAVLSLPGIPGPGILLIVLGFGVLSRDFRWAERWHRHFTKIGRTVLEKVTTRSTKEGARGAKRSSGHEAAG